MSHSPLTGRHWSRELTAGQAVAWLVCDRHRGRTVGWVRVENGQTTVELVSAPHHRFDVVSRAITRTKRTWAETELSVFAGGRAHCRRCGELEVPAELVKPSRLGTPRHPTTVPVPVRTTR